MAKKIKIKIDQAKENRKAARDVIGEPSRGRKRGPHKEKKEIFKYDCECAGCMITDYGIDEDV